MTGGSGTPVRVLHVEDDESLADVASTFLERADDDFEVATRSDADSALEYLADNEVDCIVSDHDMPGRNGLEFLDAVRESHPELPFILFTGKGSEEIASDAIGAGVTDYLQKESGSEQYTVLANRIRNAVEKQRSKQELREEKQLLEQVLATTPGSVVFQPDGRVSLATDRARATLGLDGDSGPEEVDWELKTMDGEPMPPADHPARRVARTGTPVHGERLAVEWPDGWRKYLVMHCAPLFDDEGDVDRVVASFTDITDRVEHQREIERTQTIIQAAGDAVYTLDEDATFTFVNDAFEDLVGRDRDDLLDEHISTVLNEDAIAEAEAVIENLVANGSETGILELEPEDWAPGVEYVEAHIALLPADDDVRGTVGVVRDVTERKRRERELRESEEKYATVVEEASDAVLIAQDQELKFANPRAADIVNATPEELEGAPVSEVVADGDESKVLERLQRRLDGEEPPKRYEFEAATTDGGTVPIEFTASTITYEGDPAVLAICRDVTDRRKRERQRRQYETIVETAPDAVFIVDEQAEYVSSNERAAELVGHSLDELEDKSVPELVDAGVFDPEVVPRYQETVSDLLSAGEDAKGKFEFHVYPADAEDKARVVECHLALRPYEEEFRGSIGVLRDVTERKRRERELEERNERLDEFTSVVSHDLQSPLSVATGWLDRYRETGDEDALDRVERSHERMTEILDELLALSRQGPDAREVESVPLEVVSAAAWSSVATADASLNINVAGESVEAVRGRLQELLENLFANAVEHGSTNPRSQTHEDAVEDVGEAVSVAIETTDDGFAVADDGPGIPEAERETVLEMGYTTSEEGTGFGLAIVQQIADAHDWAFDVGESEDGGARFEFATE
jgi:PAS domain S-box-containing protein